MPEGPQDCPDCAKQRAAERDGEAGVCPMHAKGRQDLAAVIAELQRELDGTRPPIQHRERIHSVPRSLLKRVLALLLAEAPRQEPVDTYTPMLWVTLNDDEKYAEYIRVRTLLAALPETSAIPQKENQKEHDDQARGRTQANSTDRI